MRILLSLVLMASVGATALNLSEIFVAPVPRELKPVGVLPIVAPDFDRIDAVLQHRAPGWGISLRARVSQAITEEAQVAGLDPLLIVALISVESEFQQDAVVHSALLREVTNELFLQPADGQAILVEPHFRVIEWDAVHCDFHCVPEFGDSFSARFPRLLSSLFDIGLAHALLDWT